MRTKPYQKITFKKFTDGRGDLVPFEFGVDYEGSNIPFDVKRCYYISAPTNDRKTVRGKHAHLDLEQVIVCVHGSFILDLEDAKGNKDSFLLNKTDEGIYIKKGLVWRELHSFSPTCVVLVFASKHYNPKDYITDYQKFRKISTQR
jgi:dTDP-4-dehydrorhamnose 3,5-epimerase-like enzyme